MTDLERVTDKQVLEHYGVTEPVDPAVMSYLRQLYYLARLRERRQA